MSKDTAFASQELDNEGMNDSQDEKPRHKRRGRKRNTDESEKPSTELPAIETKSDKQTSNIASNSFSSSSEPKLNVLKKADVLDRSLTVNTDSSALRGNLLPNASNKFMNPANISKKQDSKLLPFRTDEKSSFRAPSAVSSFDRRISIMTPEVYVIGEIVSAVGFPSRITCRYSISCSKGWSIISASDSGQTQISANNPVTGNILTSLLDFTGSSPESEDSLNPTPFNHPLEFMLTTSTFSNWPRILVQIWHVDEFSRMSSVGYGFTEIPSIAGTHNIQIRTWRPIGENSSILQDSFLGQSNLLPDEGLIFSNAWEERNKIVTISSGTVNLQLNVVTRFMDQVHAVDR